MRPWVLEQVGWVTPTGMARGAVALDGGRVLAVGQRLRVPQARRVDLAGAQLLPGLWDLHLHGAAGVDLAQASPEEVARLGRHLRRRGVTGFLASLPPLPQERLVAALERLAAVGPATCTEFLGIHLEGPFLNPRRAGALDPAAMRPPRSGLLTAWQRAAQGRIRMLTLAPEMAGAAAAVAEAHQLGMVVALGHSDADHDQARAGIAAGIRYATHFPNALAPWHHRRPGAVGAVLADPRVTLECIFDGIHLHPATEELLVALRGRERLVVVSDALPGAGRGVGVFPWGGREVHFGGGAARLGDGRLAGGGTTLDRIAERLLARFGPEAVAAWTRHHPAALLGAPPWRLAPGEAADFAVWDGTRLWGWEEFARRLPELEAEAP